VPNSFSSRDANHKQQTQEKYCFVSNGNKTVNGLLAHLDTTQPRIIPQFPG
jgi:hypothetical protein